MLTPKLNFFEIVGTMCSFVLFVILSLGNVLQYLSHFVILQHKMGVPKAPPAPPTKLCLFSKQNKTNQNRKWITTNMYSGKKQMQCLMALTLQIFCMDIH